MCSEPERIERDPEPPEPVAEEADRREPALLTVREMAAFLRIGKDLAYALAREGRVPVLRLGRRIVVPREALARWIERETLDPPHAWQ